MSTNTTTSAMIDGRRADSTRRRQRVLNALDAAVAAGDELGVTTIARRALLTELSRKSPQFNGHVAASCITVSAHDRRW
ncbi:hypothetical protein FXW78_28120 [Rhodococcus opacus]|nr:hypothetical protein [Rhodococcus opacus]